MTGVAKDTQSGGPRPQAAGSAPGRKKGTACTRCRNQKTRCDNGQPCRNCSKVGRPCIRPALGHNVEAYSQLQQRLQMLESSLRRVAPQELENVDELTPKVPGLDFGEGQAQATTVQTGDPPGEAESTANWQSSEVSSASNNDPGAPSTADGRAKNTPLNIGVVGVTVDEPAEEGSAEPLDSNAINDTSTSMHMAATSSPSASTHIKPSEPFAHEVGLLSLANSNEPKYLGPSSGVPFARLMLTAIPQSQGLRTSLATPDSTTFRKAVRPEPFPPTWSFAEDPKHFVDAYFETYQPLYPLLDEESLVDRLDTCLSSNASSFHSTDRLSLADFESRLPAMQAVQLMLVIALGARISETRLSDDFSAERYLATAMSRIDQLSLHDSIEGVQIMLLLTLCSFCFVDGPNAWFLTAQIIATCVDLGLQRKIAEPESGVTSPGDFRGLMSRDRVRRGIFWSAYSLERTLAVVLGRPLTLRDEAIDVGFPGALYHAEQPSEMVAGGNNDASACLHANKRTKIETLSYHAAQYSFRFDQLTAEMKLMLYRVNNAPGRFPWLTDTSTWQQDAHHRCTALAEEMFNDLKQHSRRGTSDSLVRALEIKYHQCLMLLHRPSPATPRPSLASWTTCCSSAVRVLHISAELNRFSKLSNSWLTAHNVFISGITFLYCLWVKPEIKNETSITSYNTTVMACANLLRFLGKTWSVAADALSKFERLVQLTTSVLKLHIPQGNSMEMAAGHSLLTLSNQAQGWSDESQLQPSEVTEADLSAFWNPEQCQYEAEPQFFFNELGQMNTWFDLDWMMNAEYGGLGG